MRRCIKVSKVSHRGEISRGKKGDGRHEGGVWSERLGIGSEGVNITLLTVHELS
jgi:hypothetical protein